MTRHVLTSLLLALTVVGCAAVNPAGTSAPSQGTFDTKLLNTISLGNQSASQTNYIPNQQLNIDTQAITANATAMFPIASLIGTGPAAATNTTAQSLINTTTQTQVQSQLVL